MRLPGAVLAFAAGAPSPTPSPGEAAALDVSPGLPGFLALFALALVVAFLVVDMTKRIRGLRYRAEIAQRRQQPEQREPPGPRSGPGSLGPDSSDPGSSDPDGGDGGGR